MEHIIKALKSFGLSDETIKNLQSEKLPDGFNLDEVINQRKSEIIQIHNQQNPPDVENIKKGAFAEMSKKMRIKFAKEVLKIADKTNRDLEDMSNDDYFKLVTETYAKELDNAGKGTNDEHKKLVDEFKSKFLQTQEELNELKGSSTRAIQEAQENAKKEVHKFKLDHFLEKKFNEVELGVPKEQWEMAKLGIRTKIDSMNWQIDPDTGELKDQSGGLAINFEKNGSYKNISEAIELLSDPYRKKSNAGQETQRVAGITIAKTANDADNATLNDLATRLLVASK
jgi:hypothetical protein